MSIRALAQELYRLEREVEDLKRQIQQASGQDRADLEDRLRKVRAERNEMRGRLDARKDPPTYRTTFKE